MNDKMMVESIFTECQKVKRVWKESGEDDNCYSAFCALYGLIEKWDLTEVYKAWEEAQKVLSNSPLTFILNNWHEVKGQGNTLNGKVKLEFIAYLYQKKEKIVRVFTYSNDINFDLIDLTTIISPL